MKNIRPIYSEDDYDWALKEIEKYFVKQPDRSSPDAARFDVLSALIENYELQYWPIDHADPIEVIKYKMDIAGLKQADLAKLLGSASRASEVLNKKRALTTDMIYKISKNWKIPADSLITPYHLAIS